jgi:hypothetical protein
MVKQYALALAASVLLGVPAAGMAQATKAACDRQCLKNIADSYVAAMVAHDPARAPLARDIRIVENVKRIGTSAGLWSRASAVPTTFRIYVPDTTSQQIGYIGVLQAEGKPALLGLRLKVENGAIVEAEHVAVYSVRPELLKNLQSPRASFSQSVPGPYKDSYGRLLKIAAGYYDALDENNGALASFADDCIRFENGMQTARNAVPADLTRPEIGMISSLGCEAQLNTNAFEYITRIDNRRVWIADEETGVAVGLSQFRHAMDKPGYRLSGIPGVESRKVEYKPFDMPAMHMFKIWGGQIHEIEALGTGADYMAPSGWER